MTESARENSPASKTVEPPDGGWGWVIVVCSFLIHVIMDGLTYSFGVLAVEFVDNLGSTRQLNGWITSVLVGVSLGAGPVASTLSEKFGYRTITIVGSSVASVGFAVSYFVTQPWMFILTIGILGGFGISLIYLPAIVCVGNYFNKRRSTAIGIAVCGSGLGIFIFGPFINYLIDQYTWRGAVLILSGVVLNCAVFGSLLRPLLPADAAPDSDKAKADAVEETQPLTTSAAAGEKEAAPNSRDCVFKSLQNLHHEKDSVRGSKHARRQRTVSASSSLKYHEPDNPHQPQPVSASKLLLASRSAFVAASALSLAEAAHQKQQEPKLSDDEPVDGSRRKSMRKRIAKLMKLSLLKDPVFLLFIGSNMLFNIGFDAPFLYTPDRAQQAGHTDKNASLLMSAIGIGNFIGRLAFGFVSDCRRVNKTALYASSLFIAGVALFFSFISSAYAFMVCYCAMFGVFVGAYVTLTPVVLASLLGPEKLNDSFGLTLLFQGIAVVVGPPVAGALFDHTNSFDISYMASGACMMLSGLILFPIPCLLRMIAARQHRTTAVQPPRCCSALNCLRVNS